jgi:hypothetical protein
MEAPQSGEQTVQSGLEQSFKTYIQGELIVSVVDLNADKVLVAYRFHQPEVTFIANGQEAITQAEIFNDALRRNIFTELSPQGHIESVWLDPELDDPSRHLVRTLLALIQFVLPKKVKKGIHQWVAQEADPSGRYIARYEFEPGTDTRKNQSPIKSIHKMKLNYLSTRPNSHSNKNRIPTEFIPAGVLIGQFDVKNGFLTALSGSQTQRIMIAGKEVGRADTLLQLTLTRNERIADDEISALRTIIALRKETTEPVSLWVRISKEKEETTIQRSELGQATLESLLYDLENAEETGKRSDTTLYLKFKALVYLHPEKSATLGVLLISAPPNSLTMRIISDALGNVGHLQAQEALVTAIRARLEEPAAVLKLLKSLGSADLPTRLAEETMRKLATSYPDWNISATAALSLGVMARKLVKTSPERSDRIIQWAISELNSSTTVNRKRLFILVLGNSGVVQALPAINKYVSDPSPGVRSSAASALRLIDSKKADELLTRFLLFDPAEKVRLEAVFAFSLRKFTPTVFDIHKQTFLKDRAEIVRLAALENIWNVHENFPEARRIVKQAADNDPSEEVRKAAKYIIAMYPESYFDE